MRGVTPGALPRAGGWIFRTYSIGRMAVGLAVLLTSSSARAAPPTKQECVDANASAQDLHRSNRLREAREKLRLCIADACPEPVRQDCSVRLDEIDNALPTLVLVVNDSAGNDAAGVKVVMDGQPLAGGASGAAVEVDPGEHRFTVEASGLPTSEKTVVVREGEQNRHVLVTLGTASATSTARSSTSPSPASPASPASPGSPSGGSSQRTIGLVVGGAGVVGVVVGTIFGLVSKSTYDQVPQSCRDASGPCSSHDAQHGEDAHSQATISTVGFVAGGALLAGGAVLYLMAPTGAVTVATRVGRDEAGLTLRGAW